MGLLNTHTDDRCCGAKLSKALRGGSLNQAAVWYCPRCGQEWRPRESKQEDGGLWRHWQPHCEIQIWHRHT